MDEAFDFSTKNFLALADLAAVLQAVVAPGTVAPAQRFSLREGDRDLLLAALSTRPADSDNPLHRERPDGYVNFLYYGGEGTWETGGPLIHNKVGDAYGTLTDAAVFSDPATGQPLFLLAATVLVNANGVYNDGVYEYEGIGFPLLRELGRGGVGVVAVGPRTVASPGKQRLRPPPAAATPATPPPRSSPRPPTPPRRSP